MKLALTRWASITLAVVMLWPSAPTLASDDSGKDSKSSSTAEAQYQALVKEHQSAQQEYFQAVQNAKTDADREKVSQNYPQPQKYAGRFLELAEKHPNEAAAIDALVWVVQQTRQGSDAEKAMQILLERHAESDKLGPVCQSLTYSASANAEKFLKAVVAKNPHRSVQGQALFSSAQYLKNRSDLVHYLKQPMAADHLKAWEQHYGKETLEQLRATTQQALLDQADKLFEQVSDKYADLPSHRGTLGDAAKAALHELRNLAIGKVAPEIEGEDLDGKKFKLSDYRGKVVVIDFWGDW